MTRKGAKKGTVLVVDDDQILIDLTKLQLKKLSYEVFTAQHSIVALELLAAHSIDILLTDIEMPDMDGIELIQEAVKRQKNLVCLVISGVGELQPAIRAMQMGAINYLEKPVNIHELEAAMGQALEKSYLLREVEEKQRSLEEANRDLAREINKSRMILSAAGEGIIGLDATGRVTFVNPVAEEVLGWSFIEFFGEDLHDLVHGKKIHGGECRTQNCNFQKQFFPGNVPVEKSEDVFYNKAGLSFPVEYVRSWIIEGGEFKGTVLVFSDITKRKKVQEELEYYRKDLEKIVWERTQELAKANKQLKKDIVARKKAEKEAELHRRQLIEADKMASLGVLVAGVAHEINNPNNFISMNTPILRRAWNDILPLLDSYQEENGDFSIGGILFSEMRDYIPELFEGIHEGSERIKNIVLNLRDYARQSVSDMNQWVNINDVLRAALVLLSNPLKNSTYHLTVNYQEDMPLFKGNFQRSEQVLINVIQNAYQSLDDPARAISLATRFDKKHRVVEVVVKDEGSGIPPDELKYIQDPFFTTKRDSGGCGLGLSISAGIMEEHGGRLEFRSKPGQGTTVLVRFPVADSAETVST
ncbi:response regulator [Thermodesulfobacteriota bacterium]